MATTKAARTSANKISGKNASMSKHPNTASGERVEKMDGANVAKASKMADASPGSLEQTKMKAGKYG